MRRKIASMDSRRGDELPDWVADKQRRIAKIREAREALEAEAIAAGKAAPATQSAAQLHRSGKPHHAQGRQGVCAGLQRAGGGGLHGPGLPRDKQGERGATIKMRKLPGARGVRA